MEKDTRGTGDTAAFLPQCPASMAYKRTGISPRDREYPGPGLASQRAGHLTFHMTQ